MIPKKIDISPEKLKRASKANEKPEPEVQSVSAGAIERVIDFAFNPSREKIREVTFINAMQAKLLPQLDIVDAMWQYVIEVAAYRQDSDIYKEVFKKDRPTPPSLIDDFIYRTAQWQKSVSGQNLKSAVDLALAETEAKAGEEGDFAGGLFDE